MEAKWLVISSSFLYLALLFGIAYWAEKNKESKWVSNPYIYALSLAVYCTAWTYYGSVGRAANQGIDFLTTYIGPLLMAPLMWIITRKLIRICKVQRITTIADFVSARYGKDIFSGGLVAFVCAIGILPYISIQIKAISNSFAILTDDQMISHTGSASFFHDTAFYITILLAIFTIIFGANKIESNKNNHGLIAAIAFESVFKLVAFLLVGCYVTYSIYDGFGDIFHRASSLPNFSKLITIDSQAGASNWIWLNFLSMLAIILLPRQFHVAVKENRDEEHLKKAMWLFPLYLLLINIFVLPIAFGGKLLFASAEVDADTYMLAIPLSEGSHLLALLTYLGGLSAATSMIIVSTTALGVMLSNNILTPLIVRNTELAKNSSANLSSILLSGRQALIVAILLLAYLYFKYVSEQFSIVSIGLISFVAVAQFAPAVILGMYWKGGTRPGAIIGIIAGFSIWFYTLVIPTIVSTGFLSDTLLDEGLFAIHFFKPNEFLGLTAVSPIASGFFWSMFFNTALYVMVSIFSKPSSKEINQAEVFVDIFQYSTVFESSIVWKGTAKIHEIKSLTSKFLGPMRTGYAFDKFMVNNKIDKSTDEADFRLVNYAEKLLSGAVGAASARVLISTVVKEDQISLSEVFEILKESKKFLTDNIVLKKKSHELEEATQQLKVANEELTKLDQVKDEFISTISHEMRTPITSIRALSEIIYDNDDLSEKDRTRFLETIIKETKRMERLINQVLDIEKMESGKINVPKKFIHFDKIVKESINSLNQIVKDKKITMNVSIEDNMPQVYANQDRLMQVILNLVSNAVKFCAIENGYININTYIKNKFITLSVEDNGEGVPDESKKLIFDAFYQDKYQNLKKPEGSGLGLAICKKIIELHQGEIWAEDGENGGAKFQFKIPIN